MAPPRRRRRYERVDLSFLGGLHFNFDPYESPAPFVQNGPPARQFLQPSLYPHQNVPDPAFYPVPPPPPPRGILFREAIQTTDWSVAPKVSSASDLAPVASLEAKTEAKIARISDAQETPSEAPPTLSNAAFHPQTKAISGDLGNGPPAPSPLERDNEVAAIEISTFQRPPIGELEAQQLSTTSTLHHGHPVVESVTDIIAQDHPAPKFGCHDTVLISNRTFQDNVFEIIHEPEYDVELRVYLYDLYGLTVKKFEERVPESALVKAGFRPGDQATISGGQHWDEIKWMEKLGVKGEKVPVTIDDVVCAHGSVRYGVLVNGEFRTYLNMRKREYNKVQKRLYGVREDQLEPME